MFEPTCNLCVKHLEGACSFEIIGKRIISCFNGKGYRVCLIFVCGFGILAE